MKIKIIIVLSLISIIAVYLFGNDFYSFQIDYSEDADSVLNNILTENNELISGLNAPLVQSLRKTAILSDKITYESVKEAIGLLDDTAGFFKYDDSGRSISYTSRRVSDGIEKINNFEEYKEIAMEYLINNIPYPISENEELEILYIKEDYSGRENKKSNGKICKKVEKRTHSVLVKIGRLFYNRPIFNSFARISIDAKTNEVIYINLNNWISVDTINIEKLSNMNMQAIKDAIGNRFEEDNENIDIQEVSVEHILPGWVFDIDAVISPAFTHYDNIIYMGKDSGYTVEEKVSLMEEI